MMEEISKDAIANIVLNKDGECESIWIDDQHFFYEEVSDKIKEHIDFIIAHGKIRMDQNRELNGN